MAGHSVRRIARRECACSVILQCVFGLCDLHNVSVAPQIELQKRASRHLKLNSKLTMEVAEKLYQSGYCC